MFAVFFLHHTLAPGPSMVIQFLITYKMEGGGLEELVM